MDMIAVKDETEYRDLALKYGLEIHEDLSSFDFDRSLYKNVPYSFVRQNLVLPLIKRDHTIIVAMANPLNLDAIDELKMLFNMDVETVYAPKKTILESINLLYNQGDGATSQLIANLSDDVSSRNKKNQSDVHDLLDSDKSAPIIKLINFIITEAIQQGASDIHIEPFEKDLKIRYRIDGVLQQRHSPPREYQSQLITRVKVMARLDIAEHRLPQDGRIKLRMGNREIDFRVSTVPTVYGERIVMRILDKGNVVLGLEKLGMADNVLKEFRQQIDHPEGIVLVTGPTGSGKTTTLYSSIYDLQDNTINIMTVEDPVEYNFSGIAQIGVQPKIDLTFAKGLKHILRQDPDVIMVGEIRDTETAAIAVQASLTGHLVLSTLHTNDAPSAVTRLVDMDIEPYLLSSTLVGVLAQRLVRRICPHCCEEYVPDEGEYDTINWRHERPKTLLRGKGCDECYHSGYKGRHGIYELLTIDDTIRSMIVKNPDAIAIRQKALTRDMQTLLEHGKQLVEEGVTTINEVLRVTRGIDFQG